MYQFTKNITLFDWIATALNVFFFAGLYIDFWTHVHYKAVDLNTFFTPTHYYFYAAFTLLSIFFTYNILIKFKKVPFLKILPPGYNLTLLGIVIFGLGGGFDLIWHVLFGIERSVD